MRRAETIYCAMKFADTTSLELFVTERTEFVFFLFGSTQLVGSKISGGTRSTTSSLLGPFFFTKSSLKRKGTHKTGAIKNQKATRSRRNPGARTELSFGCIF